MAKSRFRFSGFVEKVNKITQLALPIIKGVVFFRSFQGLYNDNPKYISIKLHELCPSLKQVWAISEMSKDPVPDYVKKVKYGSRDYCRYLCRSQVVVDNYYGIRSKIVDPKNIKAIDRFFCRKRKKQLNVSTWHGTPLKRIILDEPRYSKKGYKILTSANYVVGGCKLTIDALKKSLSTETDYKMIGTPRNDCLLGNQKNDIKEKLGINPNKKVALFAPTFRDDPFLSGVSQMNQMDIPLLLSTLKKKFGGDWCFVFRVHNEVLKWIGTNEARLVDRSNYIDGNLGDDMAEYLQCADVLITDYSGSMFDYCLSYKPCFLYTPDLENYQAVERGLYLSMSDLPFSMAMSFENLLANIENFEQQKYAKRIDFFLGDIGNCENGNASAAIASDIIKFCEESQLNENL